MSYRVNRETEKKLRDNAKNNTDIPSAGSKKLICEK